LTRRLCETSQVLPRFAGFGPCRGLRILRAPSRLCQGVVSRMTQPLAYYFHLFLLGRRWRRRSHRCFLVEDRDPFAITVGPDRGRERLVRYRLALEGAASHPRVGDDGRLI